MLPLGPLCHEPAVLADIAAHPRPPARPRSAAAPVPETCIEPNALAHDQGFGLGFDQSRATTHFLLAWKSENTAIDESIVDTYADALETSWSTEIDQMGWQAPDQSDTCLLTVLLADFDASWGDTGGYTDVMESGGIPYIILNTDWLESGDDWTDTLVAHEFNHASQFSYDVYGDESDWWYWESTAEWIPDHVYDDANTYTWSLWAWADTPWRALDSMTGTVQYGHFIFNQHLDETYGPDTPRQMWAEASDADHVGDVIAGISGQDFADVVAEYTARVSAFDVDERDVWLEALGYFEVDPWLAHVTEYPAEGTVGGAHEPEERGQSLLHFAGSPGGDVVFDFAGATDVDGVATQFTITLATVAVGGGVTYDAVAAESDGTARVEIAGLGDTITDAYVGVVPMGEIGENGAGFSWSAKVAPDGGDTGDGGEDPGVACGCESGGGGTAAGWAGMLAALAFWRRRRA